MTKEIIGFDFEVRAESDEEHGKFITGQPIVFDSKAQIYSPDRGYFTEVIERGALADTDLRDVRFLINHNTDMIPLARSRNNNENSTMQMIVDPERGMFIRVNLDVENNNEARNLYSAVERGDITGMSFMFSDVKDKWENARSAMPVRRVLSIGRVLEVSAVTFPAYEATSIQARGLSDALDSAWTSLDSERARLERIERHKLRIKLLTEV
jgi:HK97 family phage prohead protease